jgi:hypothetical protein
MHEWITHFQTHQISVVAWRDAPNCIQKHGGLRSAARKLEAKHIYGAKQPFAKAHLFDKLFVNPRKLLEVRPKSRPYLPGHNRQHRTLPEKL